jgi:hypothetical protein
MEHVCSVEVISFASKLRTRSFMLYSIDLFFSCSIGFNGNQCENDQCQMLSCENNGECFLKNNKAFCRYVYSKDQEEIFHHYL